MARRRVVPAAAESSETLESEEQDDTPIFDEDNVAPLITEKSARLSVLSKVAKEFKDFRPASQALTIVKAVPTIFPQFDFATRVGGLPIERFSLLHGPSAGGKTYWTIGLLLSFLMRDHFAYLIDAERTTPISWLRKAMGDYANHPGFYATRPKTYEKTVLDVRKFVNTIKRLRDTKKIPKTTSALIVVDSIRKLVPEDQFARIMREAKKPGDKKEKVKDRSAQIKAAMNALWLDELIPLLEETMTAMVVIARETEDPDADPMAKKFGKDFKVGGGRHLYYDASMNMRVKRVGSYGKKITVGTQTKMKPYGDVHEVQITKSKVSGKGEEFTTSCRFHISNGAIVPAGFDRARDLVEIAREFDIIEGTSWLKYGGIKWQGDDKAVKRLTEDKELFAKLDKEVRHFVASKREESMVIGDDE